MAAAASERTESRGCASFSRPRSWLLVTPLHPRGSPEKGQAVMHNAFIGTVVGVGEERNPACRQRVCIHGKAVILGRQKTAPSAHQQAGLVVATVSVSREWKTESRALTPPSPSI